MDLHGSSRESGGQHLALSGNVTASLMIDHDCALHPHTSGSSVSSSHDRAEHTTERSFDYSVMSIVRLSLAIRE